MTPPTYGPSTHQRYFKDRTKFTKHQLHYAIRHSDSLFSLDPTPSPGIKIISRFARIAQLVEQLIRNQ